MIALEVLVNGEKICTAGVGDKGVLHADVLGPRGPHLNVGGLSNDEHLRWLKPYLELKVGDEVTIRVVETDLIDEPVERSVSQTRVEREDKIIGYLQKSRSFLPDSLRESATASAQIFDNHMAQNHLMGAMDALGQLGDLNVVPAKFWKTLAEAAHKQSSYEDSKRYGKKWRSMKAETDSNQE